MISKPPTLRRTTKAFRNAAMHVLNPLHVYSRMRDIGVADKAARYVGRTYEKYIYRPTFG